MKEKEIRERLSKFNETQSIPSVFVAYATGFPVQTYLYAAPMPEREVFSKYGVPFPEDGKLPDVCQPWVITPVPGLPSDIVPEPGKVEAPKFDKYDLYELINAILALKAQSVEVYKLKALACAIRERNQ